MCKLSWISLNTLPIRILLKDYAELYVDATIQSHGLYGQVWTLLRVKDGVEQAGPLVLPWLGGAESRVP